MVGKKEVVAGCAIFSCISAFSAGFGLYEGSARGNALGGAVMGRAVDASANFYNPATLTDMTGTVITVGMTTEHPSADTYVNGRSGLKMDPGCFVLPHVYLAQELPYGFSFGLGFAPEYGLGSHYDQNWPLAWDTRQTTIEGLVLNPNLAYKVTEDWSVSAGFRLMYFSFDQYSDKMAARDGANYGTVRDHLKGDNGMLDWGWQISTKYIPEDSVVGNAIFPTAYKSNGCRFYVTPTISTLSWGFSRLFDNVPHKSVMQLRNDMKRYFRGSSNYYKYHRGEKKLTPMQQADIAQMFKKYDCDEVIYDHCERMICLLP